MEIEEVNEDANFRIEIMKDSQWHYITQEYSISTAMGIMNNLHVVFGNKSRVLSIRSNNQVMAIAG